MRKKLLPILVVAIVAVSVVVAGSALHWWGHGPSNGEVPEEPSGNETTNPPVTPSTLTMLSITEGNVFVMKAGTENWTEAQVRMTLEPGDIVKSGNSSSAEITFFDGSTIELEAGTQIEVVSLNISDTGSTTIKLKQAIGNTISRVTKLVDSASSYEVETPACVAVVRGSVMLVNVIADGTTWVTNEEGEIWVIANGVELRVPEGRKCIIIPGHPPQLVPLRGGGGGGGFSPNPDITITKMPDLMQAHDGGTITYTYIVTNPGDVPLSNVSVTDDRIEYVTYQSGDTNGDGRLGTHETWIFAATYNVTTDDATPLVNNAAAAGTDTRSRTIIAWATASVDILRPAIAINKTADREQAHVGDNITYTYNVTNPGNTPLFAISVSDNVTGSITYEDGYRSGDTDGDEILDTDETWVFTATYSVTTDDVSPLVNTATVSGTDALSHTVTAQAIASVDILQPAIAISKTAEPEQAHEGDTITYTYTVTNPGNVPLSNVSVTDDKIEDVTYQSGDTNGDEILDVDETWVFTATYTITAKDVSPLVNTATVSGTDALSQSVESEEDTASVDILRPAIAITKTAEPEQAHDGDTITYTYTITNPGNTPLSHVSVTDNKAKNVTYQSGDTDGDRRLDTNETWVFTATYTITADDVSPLVNTATVSGTDALSHTVTAQAIARVNILRPAIAITKTAEPEQAHVGDNITYTYTVTNPGNTPLSNVSVTDDKIEDVTYQSGDTNGDGRLGTRETWVFTATYTITAEDESPLVNTATVSGTDALGLPVTDEATASVTITATETASISVQVDTEWQASVFIWDGTNNDWAIDENTGQPVDGSNHTATNTTSCIIAVAGGHYYCVWVEEYQYYTYYHLSAYPEDWEISYYPVPGHEVEAACGLAEAGYLYSVSFTAPSTETASIQVQVHTEPYALVYIWDDTLGEWATYASNYTIPAIIAVAAGDCYYVWVEVPFAGCYVSENELPEGWVSTYYGEINAAYGCAEADELYPISFIALY
jgi:uncharacterized repeat protein (TIGR01451 family)